MTSRGSKRSAGNKLPQLSTHSRYFCLLLLLSCCAWSGNQFLTAAPPTVEEINRAREKAREDRIIKLAEAEAERARQAVILKALEVEANRKLQLGNLRERVEKEIEVKTKYNSAVRQWAVRESDLNLIARKRLSDGNFTTIMKRWAVTREMARQEFLTFPEKSRGAVASGRALNFFLNALGRSAVKHEKLMKELRAKGADPRSILAGELKQVESDLATALDAPDENPNQVAQLTAQKEMIQAKLLVWNMCEPLQITAGMRQRIKILAGIGGPKLEFDLNQGALPLDWPAYLSSSSDFKPILKRITNCRERAIKELKESKAISPETQNLLMEYVDDLDQEFDNNHRSKLKHMVPGTAEYKRVFQNIEFIRKLKAGVFRFLEARFPEDIAAPAFESNSLPELLSIMVDNGYQFGKAPVANEVAYQQLFEMMTRYYTDIYGLHMAVTQSETDVAKLREESQKLAAEEARETATGIMAAGQVPPLKTLADLLDSVQGAAGNLN